MSRSGRRIFLLLAFFLLTGMMGRGAMGRGELKPEIRLKLYDEAILHYEKAKALQAEGRREEALQEIQKSTKLIRAFPEAYDLAGQIHLELGNQKEAEKNEALFRLYEGDKGASLYRLREGVAQEIDYRKRSAPPPDIPVIPAFLVSGLLIGISIFGMRSEYERLLGKPEKSSETERLFLERFPDEEGREIIPSLLFKAWALFLPAPFLFSFLVLLGLRNYSDLFPVFLFSFLVVDLAVYFIFFADLSDLGGFRRPGAA